MTPQFRGPLCALALVLLLPVTASAAPADSPGNEAPDPVVSARTINVAGRQRMLTQRVVKLYAQVGLNVASASARAQLEESLALLSAQTTELEPLARTGPARAPMARMQKALPPLLELARTEPRREKVARLDAVAAEMLAAAEALTAGLEKTAPLGHLVNIAGRQRMVSQRLAKLYMLRAWGIDVPGSTGQSRASEEEFTAALGLLMRAEQNDPEIDRELYAVAVQWEWFRTALALDGVASYTLVVADASEGLLRSLERIVGLYEKASAR